MTSTAKQRRKQTNTCDPAFGYKPLKSGREVACEGVCAHARMHASSSGCRGQTAVINIALQQQQQQRVCMCVCVSATAGARLRICIDTNGRRSVRGLRVCSRVHVTHSSVVSLGMPLGRECSPLLLQRTTLSEHEQTSGQPDAGRQPLSSTPERETEREREGRERDRESE